jgi:hypothetical protein
MIRKTVLVLAAPLLLNVAATSPPAYAAGTISRCPTTITSPGTWTVTTNVTAAAGVNCITVDANGVAIDLRGHVITGSGLSSGIVDRGGQTNLVVANGTLTGFNQAINLGHTSHTTISNITVTNTGTSGIHIGADYGVVTDSQANNNQRYGIYFDGSNNTVSNTVANNNGWSGITFLPPSSNNTVSNSVAYANGLDGMVFGGTSNTVSNSPAIGNGNNGMVFDDGDNQITDNQANNNKAGDGVVIGKSGNSLTGNVANGNGSIGISVVCPSNLYDNTATGSPGGGIVTSGSPACARLDNSPTP